MESRFGEEELKEIENVNHHVKEELDLEEIKDQTEDVKRIPPWTNHITIRGLIASVAIGIIYSVIVMKLNLTTGLVPNLNVSAALLAFVFVRTWTKLLHKAGITATPFTRQENTVIQTCAVACYSIAVGGLAIFYLSCLFLACSPNASICMPIHLMLFV